MMSQPWRCLNECPRVGLVRGRRDRAGFPGRGDAPARTRVTRLRVGKLLARSQSRQTDCPRFSRHTRWPPGTDPSPRETQTTPATTIHSPRETQTTPAPRKTLKYTDNQPAGAVPVTSPPPTPHAGAVPVTSGNLTTSSTHRSDTPVKPRPPQLREKPSNTPKTPRRGGPGYITTTNTPRRGGPGYIWRSHHLFHPQIRHPHETQTTPAPRKTLKYAKKRHAGAVPVTSGNLTTSSTHRSDTPVKPRPPPQPPFSPFMKPRPPPLREKPSNTPKNATQGRSRLHQPKHRVPQGRSRLHQPKHRVPQGRSRLHQPGHHTTRRGPTVSAARRQVRRPRHRLGAPRACLSRAQPGPSPGRRRARRGRGGSARR